MQNGLCVMEVPLSPIRMLICTKKKIKDIYEAHFHCLSRAVWCVFNPVHKNLHLLLWVSDLLFSVWEIFLFLQSTVLISKPKECEINVVLHTNNEEYKRPSKFRVSLRYQVCFLCKWLMPSRRNNNYMAQGGGKKAYWVIQAFSQNITETSRKKMLQNCSDWIRQHYYL